MAGVFRAFDLLMGPKLFEFVWRIIMRTSALTPTEIHAACSVVGTTAIHHGSVRVAEGRLLGLIFRFNRARAFTTFHTINLPSSGHHSRPHLEILIHEIVHVMQFERVGGVYIWQALRAQRTNGYRYGGWTQLADDWQADKHFWEYDREQQGQIAQDYYEYVVEKGLPGTDPVRRAYEPFIEELRGGKV